MYKNFSILLFIILFSCDDGNFEVPSFEFNDTVNTCGSYVIYRTNSDQTEAFIIELSNTEILSEETVTPIETPITATNVQYRIFNGIVNPSYFCADIPPVTPSVTRNWEGVAGSYNKISITTTAVLNDDDIITGYEHQITLINLVLESNGDSQTFESYYFGSFITDL